LHERGPELIPPPTEDSSESEESSFSGRVSFKTSMLIFLAMIQLMRGWCKNISVKKSFKTKDVRKGCLWTILPLDDEIKTRGRRCEFDVGFLNDTEKYP
jgi:hypothetical protein